MIPRKKHPSPWYNMHDVSRGNMPTDEFLHRLELSYNDFYLKHLLEEQILPKNL